MFSRNEWHNGATLRPYKTSTSMWGGSTGKARLRLYCQHIWQPKYYKLKVEEHLSICGKDLLDVFFARNALKYLWQNCEIMFQEKFKTKLNRLSWKM